MFREVIFASVLLGVTAPGLAQPAKDGVSVRQTITTSATITAINKEARTVTLKSEQGDVDTFTVGPEVTRFDQLKVGDTIRATYSEAVVVTLRKPGAAPTAPTAAMTASRLKDVPGGAAGAVVTATVTVKAIDHKTGSITVATTDGMVRTRKVADARNLEGIKVGDTLDITYTQSLLVSAESPKK
jgi:Cu/Ag efflux protein CusF